MAGIAAAAAFALALTALSAPAPAAPADVGPGAAVAAKYAGPVLSAFADQAEGLQTKIETLCDKPDQAALETAQQAFRVTAEAWGRASVLRFGPLAAQNRFEHIFFWPDPGGFIAKQLRKALAEKDPQAATSAGIRRESVAVQGLPALDALLFGNDAELVRPGDYRCRFAAAAAGNVAALAAEVRAGWGADTDFTSAFTAPATGKSLYLTPEEVATEVAKAMSTVLQFAAGAEVAPALGDDLSHANGKRAPLWHGDATLRLLSGQIGGVRDLYEVAGFPAALPADQRHIDEALEADFRNALGSLADIRNPAETAFTDIDDNQELRYLLAVLNDMNDIVSEHLTAALGLRMGFNALDGD